MMTDLFRIVAFGSSSTEGSGATAPARTYPARLQARLRTRNPWLGVEVLNRGVGGDDILAMAARLDRDVCGAHAALVIWQVGSNDPLQGVGLDVFRSSLAAGAMRIRAGASELMLMEPQWSPALRQADARDAFVHAVREVGHQRGLYVVRRHDLMQQWFAAGRASPDDVIGPDGLHMTDLGYDLLAEAVCDAVVGHSAAYRRALGTRVDA